MKEEFYRPVNIEFAISNDGTGVPESLGEFPDWDEAAKFLGTHFTSFNQPVTTNRLMDTHEKVELRRNYTEILEDVLPKFGEALSKAELELSAAKENQKRALEAYNVTVQNVKDTAAKIKRGLVEMNLDEKFTARLAYKGRYYFFTYIDKQLRLCKIKDIPDYEKTEIWNQMAGNEEFLDNVFGKEKTDKKKK